MGHLPDPFEDSGTLRMHRVEVWRARTYKVRKTVKAAVSELKDGPRLLFRVRPFHYWFSLWKVSIVQLNRVVSVFASGQSWEI